MPETNDTHQEDAPKKKPCRACNSYTDQKKSFMAMAAKFSKKPQKHLGCPLDREELGRHTWGYLHTMAAYWLERPTRSEQSSMNTFVKTFSHTYPCEDCAYALREWMVDNPPRTANNLELSKWFCEAHNEVNERLGKKQFDCNLVLKRWKDGWDDGSCD